MSRRRKNVSYRPGFSAPVPADVAHAELENIRGANGGLLRPADVVRESRPDDAPLHGCFTWDDSVAAERYREDEARRLVRSVCVLYEQSTEHVGEPRPVYVHVRSDNWRDEPGYQPVLQVMAQQESREALVADAIAQLRGWQKRYRWLQELARLHEAIGRELPPDNAA